MAATDQRGISRREALRQMGLVSAAGLAACAAACSPSAPAAPTAAPAAAATTAPGQATTAAAAPSWADVVAAAKQEGTLSVATYAGTGYRKVMDDFEAAYPGVKVEQTGFQSSSRDFVPRFLQERQAGIFNWDLALMPSPEMLIQVVPTGGLASVKSLLVHPEVVDDKNWVDGLAGGFVDNAKQFSYAITRARSQSLWIDTNQVKPEEVTSYRSLLDPKWKGKLLAGDLRTKGSGFNTGTVLRLKTHDEDILRKVYKDQDAVLSTDARQLTEFAARGSYPISLGAVSKPILLDFLAQGVGKNLKAIPFPEVDYVFSGSNLIHYVSQAPHPNAAKLFVNWVLTREGSTSFSRNLQDNSRRADVAPFDPETVPEKGVDYTLLDAEDVLPEIQKTQDLAKALLN
jgi:iron(III) transport system substrate-binding protein